MIISYLDLAQGKSDGLLAGDAGWLDSADYHGIR
jgi:hypothetical protein